MERALRTMLKLMPGIPIEEQLHRGGSQWRTFVDLIRGELPTAVPRYGAGGRRRKG